MPTKGIMKISSSQAMPLDGRRFLGTRPRATTLTVKSIKKSAVAIHPDMPVTFPHVGAEVVTQIG